LFSRRVLLAMKLSDILQPELILVPLEAADKWQAISLMARVASQSVRAKPPLMTEIEEALLVRERSMTTGMEHGIAIPHAAVDGIDDVIAVVGISPDGVEFGALDGEPARILVCLVIPRAKKLLHIKTLAAIARLLTREEVRERLLQADSRDAVMAVIREEEGGAASGGSSASRVES
jgi:mannitol/fructose-specific phosphotransferase system IIA component (Ntr-type)